MHSYNLIKIIIIKNTPCKADYERHVMLMVQISEVTIFSIDKSDDNWAIEGEILFESDLTTAFSVNYIPDDDELDDLEIEIIPGKYDKRELKEMILEAANEFDE